MYSDQELREIARAAKVLAATDFMARVKGGYAPARLNIAQQSELRVAGLSPAQLDQAMLARVAELIERAAAPSGNYRRRRQKRRHWLRRTGSQRFFERLRYWPPALRNQRRHPLTHRLFLRTVRAEAAVLE